MFKVICIAELDPEKNVRGYKCPSIPDECTVISQEIDEVDGVLMYEFAEYPPVGKWRFFYDARAFAIIQRGPDEVEFAQKREAEMIQRLDRAWNRIEQSLNEPATL